MANRLKILLLTGIDDAFVSELVSRLDALPEVEFRHVLLWQRTKPAAARIRKNIRKHGLIYVPWRIGKLVADRVLRPVRNTLLSLLLAPSRQPDLVSACAARSITVHHAADAHDAATLALVRSLGCDLLLLCGTGIIREPLISLARLGTINLHQGEVPFYRGAPPGFWELWNKEDHAAVTVHAVDSGLDTGAVILQQRVPIFPSDDHARLRDRLSEVSLALYPKAVQQVAQGIARRVPQRAGAGRVTTFPTLLQTLRLAWRTAAPAAVARSFVKSCVFPVVLLAIAARDLALRLSGRDILSVLYYHRVTDLCRDGMTVGRAAFEQQLRFLTRRYRILDPRDLSAWLARKRTGMGEKAVLITFDDGYEDNHRNAFPLLLRYGCPALFFVSTAHIGTGREFGHDRSLQPRLRFANMNWKQVRELQEHGMTIGVHSHDHCDLAGLPLDRAVEQVELSIRVYIDELRRKPHFMSYPFGGRHHITQQVAGHVGRATPLAALFCAYGNKNISPFDPLALNRVNIGSGDNGLVTFWFKTEGGLQTLLRPRETPWSAQPQAAPTGERSEAG